VQVIKSQAMKVSKGRGLYQSFSFPITAIVWLDKGQPTRQVKLGVNALDHLSHHVSDRDPVHAYDHHPDHASDYVSDHVPDHGGQSHEWMMIPCFLPYPQC